MIEVVAEYRENLCDHEMVHKGEVWSGIRQAQAVADRITVQYPWSKWLGCAGLRLAYDEIFHPIQPYQGAQKVDVTCHNCNDMSLVEQDDGHFEWCDCDGARRLKEQDPGLLKEYEDSARRSAAIQRSRWR